MNMVYLIKDSERKETFSEASIETAKKKLEESGFTTENHRDYWSPANQYIGFVGLKDKIQVEDSLTQTDVLRQLIAILEPQYFLDIMGETRPISDLFSNE